MPTLTIRYDSKGFGPVAEHKVMKVKKSDTLTFELHPDTLKDLPAGRLRITMPDAKCFSPVMLEHAKGEGGSPLKVKVLDFPSAAIGGSYQCELLGEDGKVLVAVKGNAGGG